MLDACFPYVFLEVLVCAILDGNELEAVILESVEVDGQAEVHDDC